ncbi:hypothetical protein HI914_05976 [Erysiphe necator]|nr:hypothetical protein HI914_05976 [Erysiphe necator]
MILAQKNKWPWAGPGGVGGGTQAPLSSPTQASICHSRTFPPASAGSQGCQKDRPYPLQNLSDLPTGTSSLHSRHSLSVPAPSQTEASSSKCFQLPQQSCTGDTSIVSTVGRT